MLSSGHCATSQQSGPICFRPRRSRSRNTPFLALFVCFEPNWWRKRAHWWRAGGDAGIISNAAAILVGGDVANVVVAVFDAPVASDDVGPCAGLQAGGGGDVAGDLAALIPHAGGGTAQPGAAGDADDGVDEGAHSVSARALPTGKTSTLRRSWRDRPMVVETAVSAGTARAMMAWAASSRWARLSLS